MRKDKAMTRHKKILTMSRKVSKRVTDEQGNLTRCRNVNVQVLPELSYRVHCNDQQ